MSRHTHEHRTSSRRPGGLRRTIHAHRSRLSLGALGVGWVALLADDTVGWAVLPGRIHGDITAALVAGTVVAAVAAVLRGKALYEAMRFGRLVEAERRQLAEQRLMDAPTHGIGVRVN